MLRSATLTQGRRGRRILHHVPIVQDEDDVHASSEDLGEGIFRMLKLHGKLGLRPGTLDVVVNGRAVSEGQIHAELGSRLDAVIPPSYLYEAHPLFFLCHISCCDFV